MLQKDSSRALRITGWVVIAMGATHLLQTVVKGGDGASWIGGLAFVGFGWWLVGRARARASEE